MLPPTEHHSRRFWHHFYGLVERYGTGGGCALTLDDAYLLSRHYRVTAIMVAAELGARAARSNLALRVPGEPQPRGWLDESIVLEDRLREQACDACTSDA